MFEIIAEFLPPSSKFVFFKVLAHCFKTFLPISVEPTKHIREMLGSLQSFFPKLGFPSLIIKRDLDKYLFELKIFFNNFVKIGVC